MSFDFDPATGVILSESDGDLMPDSPETPDKIDGLDDLGETLAQVEVEGSVPGPSQDAAPAPESDEEAEPKHANVFEFFDETFSMLYELYDTDPDVLKQNAPVMVWCQQWWLHKAVLGRVTAAWYAWEDSYASGGGAMSSWILEHADRHFDRIMADDGPFRRCKGGHNRALKKYPTIPPLEPEEDPEQQAAEAYAQNTQRESVPQPAAGRGHPATEMGGDHQPPPPPQRIQAREY